MKTDGNKYHEEAGGSKIVRRWREEEIVFAPLMVG